jgi:hypothetical protein
MIDCQPQLHIAAIHAEAGYRTAVPGLALLCINDELILSVGAYQNSIGKHSNYIVGGMYLGAVGSIRYGVIAGAVDGYQINNGNAIPMAAGIVSFPFMGHSMHLTLIPPVPNYTPALVQVSLSF